VIKKLSIVLISVFLLNIFHLRAEERDSLLVKKTVVHVWNDSKNWAISPIKWDKTDWLIFGSVTAATGTLIAWGDQSVYNYANTLHTKNRDQFFKYIQPLGNTYLFVTMSAFFVSAVLTKNNYTFETSLIVAESFSLTGIACQITKMTTGRARPNNEGTTNPHQWDGPFFNGHSFFSGHTSSVFSVASVIAYRYRDTKWIPILSYGLATLGGLERIYDNRHWTSDVFFGAAIGTATGIFLCKSWEKNTIRFYPTALPGGAGLSMVIPVNSQNARKQFLGNR